MKRPILYVLIPFILGIASSPVFKAAPSHIFFLSMLLFAASLLFSRKNIFSHVVLYMAVFLFGIFYLQNSSTLPADHISRFAPDHPVKALLKGVISDDPVASRTRYNKVKTDLVLSAESIKMGDEWHRSRGLVDVSLYIPIKEPLHFGQRIIMEGKIKKPVGLKNPGLFDYERYLAIKDIYAVFNVNDGSTVEIVSDNAYNRFKAVAYRIRNWMRAVLDRRFEAPYSGFIKAIMIGDRTDLKYSLNSDFVKTGTIHAIAISGLNVGLIAAIFLAVLALLRLPKKASLALVAIVMILYTFIAGSSPPIVRAVIIFIVFVAGYMINRESDMMNSLAFTAFVMLLANPKELFDPSFQLSFASIAGMVVFVPKINGLFRIDMIGHVSIMGKARMYILTAISVSISAWLATWPIVASYFNIISPISLLANLVVVPALFLLTAASFLILIADLFSGFLAGLLALILSAICGALFTANHFLAGLPMAYIRIPAPSGAFIALYYAALALIYIPANIEFIGIIVRRTRIALVMLTILNIMVWADAAALGKDELKITFLDVGQGDSALVELPGGKNVLIDAGPGGDEDSFDAARSVVAPYLWNRKIRKLDALVFTHFHEDHLGGAIYLLENFRVDKVIDNGAYCEGSEIFNKYLRILKEKNMSREIIRRGDRINFDGGTILVLNPERDEDITDRNENSIVLKLHYKNFDALFCGDASGPALKDMVGLYGKSLRSDIIKIPHHGGNIGDAREVENFFNAVGARVAIISVAKNNKYRSPSQKTLEALNTLDPLIYETKDNGAITVSVNRGLYEVEPYIKNN